MRLLSFLAPPDPTPRVGLLAHDGARVVDLSAVGVGDMFDAVARVWELGRVAAHLVHAPGALSHPLAAVRLLAPLPSARTAWVDDPVAATAGASRGLPLLAEAPFGVRYADPAPILASGDALPAGAAGGIARLGVGVVIGREARGLTEARVEQAIAGYCVAALWAANEDDAYTAAGPWLVTGDELRGRRVGPAMLDLAATVAVNGRVTWSGSCTAAAGGGALLAQVSASYTLRPGDLLGVGVVSLPAATGGVRLAAGDDVVFEVERLGALRCRVGALAGRVH